MKAKLLLLALAAIFFFTGNQSFGQCSGPVNNSYFTKGQTGSFSDYRDWSLNTAPSTINQLVIKNGLPMSLSTAYTLNGTNCLIIEANSSLSLSNNGELTIAGNYHIINEGTITGNGVLNIGPGCTLTNNGSITSNLVNSGTINGTGSITIASGKYFTNNNNNGNAISNTIINNGTININSSVTSSSPITNNSGIVISGWATLTNASTISGPGTISISGSGSAVINQGVISGAGDITIGASCNFVNEATASISSKTTGSTLTVSGVNGRFNNFGFITGPASIAVSSSGIFNNTGTISVTGTVQLNGSAALNNGGTLSASGSWNVANGSSVSTSGPLNSGPFNIATSNVTISLPGVINATGDFTLQSGPGQLNITSGARLNASGFRVNSGSFTNNGIMAFTGDFTNNSSSTVYNNARVMVGGNFVNTTSFMNNGPAAPAEGITIAGNFSNSGIFDGDGDTEVDGYSLNQNNGNMTGTQRFCDKGNPPGGIDRNQGAISVTIRGCSGITPLPVTFVSFDGKLKGGAVYLDWATSDEKNSDKFIIEKSGASLEWKEIGSVKAAGNSTNLQTYTFKDESGLNGTAYYRLKQVDLDGSFQYSKIISFSGKILPAMEVYPNPATANFSIKAPQQFENATVELVNTTGAVVYKKEIGAIKASEALEINLETQKPTSGLYLVRIISDGKAVVTPQSIIIN